MIKRDFTAWDFIKQEPKKKGHTILDGHFTVDTSSWTIVNTNPEYGINTTNHNIIHLGYNNEGLRIDGDNLVTINDLVVNGSAEIPPQEGQMRYNVDSGMTEFYHQDEWLELGYTHEIHSEPKKSLWTKFKNLFKFKA